MNETNKSKTTQTLPGRIIDGWDCHSCLVIGNIIVATDTAGNSKVFERINFEKTPKAYQIDGEFVESAFIPKDHEILILKTAKQSYIRDFNNLELKEARHWADYYFEPYTASFFRKDNRGNWYDIDGYRMTCPVFKLGHVLCSLDGKTSRDSMAFQDHELIVSPGETLIQVGKLVFNTQLQVVLYFGEKITGLGSKSIELGDDVVLQEVRLGLDKYGFVNEATTAPYLINDEEITAHVQTVVKGRHRYEVFRSDKRTYIVNSKNGQAVFYKDKPLTFDFDTFIEMGTHELMLAQIKGDAFYVDINTLEPFSFAQIDGEKVRHISTKPCRVGSDLLYNIKTDKTALVFNISKESIFTLNDGQIQPESISDPQSSALHYAYANYNGGQRLFYKNNKTIVTLAPNAMEVSTLVRSSKGKLLVAQSAMNQPIVLDARRGYDQLQLATCGEYQLTDVVDEPYELSDTILKNVMVETLGGSAPRVVDLNDENLSAFTFPKDMSMYPDQYEASGFQGNIITSVDVVNPITKGDYTFYKAKFICYFGHSHSVLLHTETGRPLQLDGAGHRNELVTGFNEATFKKEYRMGSHRMVGAHTLTEDLKENQLLFSLENFKSWLPFYDAYLPIFKKVVEVRHTGDWSYLLFELREITGDVEYVVVEREEPFRIWARKEGGKPVPKLIKEKEKALKSPEGLSAFRRLLLLNNGFLSELE